MELVHAFCALGPTVSYSSQPDQKRIECFAASAAIASRQAAYGRTRLDTPKDTRPDHDFTRVFKHLFVISIDHVAIADFFKLSFPPSA